MALQLREAAESEEDEHGFIRIESSDADPERIGLDEIGEKVREYTALAAGEGKDVCDRPIELKIYRQDQENLTSVRFSWSCR